MPRGTDRKREREYEQLTDSFHEEGRYKGREEEVAARIVNKQRAQQSETKEEQQEDRQGSSPDRALSIAHYDHLTVKQIAGQLNELSPSQIKAVRRYEEDHRHRTTLLQRLAHANPKG